MSITLENLVTDPPGEDYFEVLAEITTKDGESFTLFRDATGDHLHYQIDAQRDEPWIVIDLPPGLLRYLANASEGVPLSTVDYAGRA
jgi:hypothetical protein